MLSERIVKIGTQRHTMVVCKDESGAGGACHAYVVLPVKRPIPPVSFAEVDFQNGPVAEHGVNGCHNEDLIAIVLDRLQGFQKGTHSCRENALAITRLEEALHWLHHRTADRERRGVEGTSQK